MNIFLLMNTSTENCFLLLFIRYKLKYILMIDIHDCDTRHLWRSEGTVGQNRSSKSTC